MKPLKSTFVVLADVPSALPAVPVWLPLCGRSRCQAPQVQPVLGRIAVYGCLQILPMWSRSAVQSRMHLWRRTIVNVDLG